MWSQKCHTPLLAANNHHAKDEYYHSYWITIKPRRILYVLYSIKIITNH